MSHPPRQDHPNLTQPTREILQNDSCPRCEQLLNDLNTAFHGVHSFILVNYEGRSDNDSYLGELGRLIHAQVTARRALTRHQSKH